MRTLLFSAFALTLLALAGISARADDPMAVIKKAVDAHGGQDRLAKFKAYHIKYKGVLDLMGNDVEFTAEEKVQAPDRMRNAVSLDFNGQKLEFIRVLNGKEAWVHGMGETKELEGDELTDIKNSVFADYVEMVYPLLTDKRFELKSIDGEKVNDKPAVGVKVSAKGFKDISVYFDKETGLLVKVKRKARNLAQEEVEAEVFYLDYKDVQGTKQAMKQKVLLEGKKYLDAEMTEFKLLEKLDDSTFEKP